MFSESWGQCTVGNVHDGKLERVRAVCGGSGSEDKHCLISFCDSSFSRMRLKTKGAEENL